MWRKGFALLVAATFVITAGAASASPVTSEGCYRDDDGVYLHTYRFRVSSARDVYRVGDTLYINVKVTRSLRAPDGSEVEPDDGAVAGLDVVVGVETRKNFIPAGATTDANGIARFDIETWDGVSRGWAHVHAYARKKHADIPYCDMAVGEEGHDHRERLFRII